jgi:hypothetical protein
MWSEALLGFYWDLALGSAITIAQFQITKAWHVVRVGPVFEFREGSREVPRRTERFGTETAN